ncbi:MAG: MBL fold metallo-hydrolase [Bacillota bacterium]|nr:MBL fold metallo-hydrolase [Bacillota bacterium]MDP4170576.1 MBL fold metallo-hydrolase [Bacillota bacterium]
MICYKDKHTTIFHSSLYQTTSTVVETDHFMLVVDPCWLPGEVEEIRHYVYSRKGERPLYLLFTHSDYDHIIGYNAFPDAITIGSKGMERNLEKDSILEQIRDFDDSYYIKRNYEIAYPQISYLVSEDGQNLQIGEYCFTFYVANGHTNDGLFTVIEPLGLWIAGDYLSDIEFPYIYSSSIDYEKTLETAEAILNRHSIKLLIPGHGSVTTEIDEITKRINESRKYIHNTRQLLLEKKEVEAFQILKHYDFPKVMEKFLRGNLELMKKELKLENE